jgi:hypothetical protein
MSMTEPGAITSGQPATVEVFVGRADAGTELDRRLRATSSYQKDPR